MSSFNSKDFRRLLLKAVQRERSQVVMTSEYRGADNSYPLVAMLFSDNVIRVYFADTLELAVPAIDLRSDAPIKTICFFDGSKIVTGGADGYISVFGLDSCCVLTKFKAHKNAVVAIDCSYDLIASVGADKQLTETSVATYPGDSTPPSSIFMELSCVPMTVRSVELNGQNFWLVVNASAPHFKFYPVGFDWEGLEFDMLWNLDSPDGCKLVDIAFDKTCPSYVAAFSCAHFLPTITDSIDPSSYLHVITGQIDNSLNTQNFVANTGDDIYWKCKVALDNTGQVWVLDNNGVVSYGRLVAGRYATTILEHDNPVVSLYVSQIDGLDVVVTGDKNKRVLQWKYSE